MGTVTVSIYERVKSNGKWTRVHIQPPQGRKRDGKLFLKDDRQGKYLLSWYENRQKQWQHVKGRVYTPTCQPHRPDELRTHWRIPPV
jgi:hypothetical protein